MTRGYREDIDWLRAIAVMAVIAFHFEVTRHVHTHAASSSLRASLNSSG